MKEQWAKFLIQIKVQSTSTPSLGSWCLNVVTRPEASSQQIVLDSKMLPWCEVSQTTQLTGSQIRTISMTSKIWLLKTSTRTHQQV